MIQLAPKSSLARVLCVETDPHLREWLDSVLAGRFAVVRVADTATALEALTRDGPFELVVCDAASAALLERAAVVAPGAGRILVTGSSARDAPTPVNEDGGSCVVARACSSAELTRLVDEAFERSQQRVLEGAIDRQRLDAMSIHIVRTRRAAARARIAAALVRHLPGAVTALTQIVRAVRQRAAFGRPASPLELDVLSRACDGLTPVARYLAMVDAREPQPSCDPVVAAESVVALLRASGLCDGMELAVHAEVDTPPAAVGGDDLEHVILELLLNAVDALELASRDAPAVYVKVGRSGEGRVACAVGDNGRGIPPHSVPLVFEPNFSTKVPPGTGGLGLFAVREIVARAGGEVEISSEVDLHTVVTVTLPSRP
ncbi:MAG: hypothetical protein JNL38_38260 [Myxococcales bacterium]|nr:hypothetical protein [Myxococcales bacterium]